jgi:ABC-2 type transport system ATP-binding protein
MPDLVFCNNVSKIYGSNVALRNLTLTIPSGRIIGLLGPNGSGKTTLIKLLCGLLTPTEGNISICGMPVGPQSKAMVSYLPDRTYVPDWMKVREMLDYFCDFYQDFRRPLAEMLLANLHISLDAPMKTLSKGNKEKVQLILVMSRYASLYLLDEPIAGVDPVARDYILDTIIKAHNPQSSVIISTHLINDIEQILDEVIMIKYGSLALCGDANGLRKAWNMTVNDIFKEVFRGC